MEFDKSKIPKAKIIAYLGILFPMLSTLCVCLKLAMAAKSCSTSIDIDKCKIKNSMLFCNYPNETIIGGEYQKLSKWVKLTDKEACNIWRIFKYVTRPPDVANYKQTVGRFSFTIHGGKYYNCYFTDQVDEAARRVATSQPEIWLPVDCDVLRNQVEHACQPPEDFT